jgi:valyl-tRNA synthetase
MEEDKKILGSLEELIKMSTEGLEKYKFKEVGDAIYHFMWDELADKYIEVVKSRGDKEVVLSVLRHVFSTSLKLLHPFMPFVTEEVWAHFPRGSEELLIVSSWPE